MPWQGLQENKGNSRAPKQRNWKAELKQLSSCGPKWRGRQGKGHMAKFGEPGTWVLVFRWEQIFTELGPPKTPVKWWVKTSSPAHVEDEVLLVCVLHEDKKSPLKIYKNRPAFMEF